MKKIIVISFVFFLVACLCVPSFALSRGSSLSLATDKVYLFLDFVDDADDPFESFDIELKFAGGIWRVVETLTYEDIIAVDKVYKIPDSVLNTVEANSSYCEYRIHGFTLLSSLYSSSVRIDSSGVHNLIAEFDSPYRIVWTPVVGASSYNVRFVSSVFGTLDFYTDAVTLFFNIPDSVTVGALLPEDTIITVRTTVNGVTYSCNLRPLSGYTIITVPVDTSLRDYDPADISPNGASYHLGLLWKGVTATSVWAYVLPALTVCASMGAIVFIINKVH